MRTVIVTIKLEVDDSKEDIDLILQEMDCSFEYCVIEDEEIVMDNAIVDTEIQSWDIQDILIEE